MKNLICSTIISVLIITFFSCDNTLQKGTLIKFNGQALGTVYSISYYDTQNRNFQSEIESLFDSVNNVFSIYNENSFISNVNNNIIFEIGNYKWFEEVFSVAKIVHTETGGAFDPTIAPLVNAWGFGKNKNINTDSINIDSLRQIVGFDKISISNGKIIKEDLCISLDFNAIAKGFCTDVAASYLKNMGIDNFLVEVGGEIASEGSKINNEPWRIGIEKPSNNAYDGQEVLQIIKIKDKAMATSGNYRRYYEKDGQRYAHTIDPKTGHPVENNLLSVTVIADKCVFADAYATAFMVLGVKNTLEFANNNNTIDAFMIYTDENNDLKTIMSTGFQKILE